MELTVRSLLPPLVGRASLIVHWGRGFLRHCRRVLPPLLFRFKLRDSCYVSCAPEDYRMRHQAQGQAQGQARGPSPDARGTEGAQGVGEARRTWLYNK